MAMFDLIANSTTLVLAATCFTILLLADYWKKLYFIRNGIPGPFPLPILGTFSFKGFTNNLVERRQQYGKVYGISFGLTNVFMIQDLDILQEIMISKFSSFPNRTKPFAKDRPFDQSVSLARDSHWKAVRNTLIPAFTGSKMKQMTPLLSKACDQLVQNFAQKMGTEGIQCKDLFGAYSMDVVASVFFGLQVDSQSNPDDPFVKNAKKFFNFSVLNPKIFLAIFVPGMGKLFDLFNVSLTDPYIKKFFLDVTSKALQLRNKEGSTRMDILQLMANAHQMDTKEAEDDKDFLVNEETTNLDSLSKTALSTDEIMANAVIFFLAGYETTNAALCFTSYLLATHSELQDKLIQEVDKFTPTKEDVTYDVLNQMEYLDCIIRESLRMYPPAAILDRGNSKGDIEVKGVFIPKGFSIFVPVYAIHHDPEIWEDPEEFKPERFNKENRGKILPVSWLPFGDGPRNCIGMRLALMEIKFALVRTLQEFKFETCSDTEIPPVLNKTSVFISPPNGITLQVVQREKAK